MSPSIEQRIEFLERKIRSLGAMLLNRQGSSGAGLVDGDYGDITVGGSGTTMTIDAEAVNYAKMQHVSATDKILGRSTAGAGDVEEIACTSAGRALIDDANAAAQLTTLGAMPIAGGTFTGAAVSADHGTASTAQIVSVCYGTGSAPTASTTPEGSLWIKYTA